MVPLGTTLLFCFLAGLLPTMLWYKLSRWRVRRKLTKAEARLAAHSAPTAATAAPMDPETSLLARARAAGGAAGYAGDPPERPRSTTTGGNS
jgi:hypothetical protein